MSLHGSLTCIICDRNSRMARRANILSRGQGSSGRENGRDWVSETAVREREGRGVGRALGEIEYERGENRTHTTTKIKVKDRTD